MQQSPSWCWIWLDSHRNKMNLHTQVSFALVPIREVSLHPDLWWSNYLSTNKGLVWYFVIKIVVLLLWFNEQLGEFGLPRKRFCGNHGRQTSQLIHILEVFPYFSVLKWMSYMVHMFNIVSFLQVQFKLTRVEICIKTFHILAWQEKESMVCSDWINEIQGNIQFMCVHINRRTCLEINNSVYIKLGDIAV